MKNFEKFISVEPRPSVVQLMTFVLQLYYEESRRVDSTVRFQNFISFKPWPRVLLTTIVLFESLMLGPSISHNTIPFCVITLK